MQAGETPLVSTIKELCRVCYTCVRECPAKAIRIEDQQAEIITERCIACGNCVKVCSQNAKQAVNDLPKIRELLAGDSRVAAIVAPSFPAALRDVDHLLVVGMLRKLGFDLVSEVSFGADLVAHEYRKLLHANPTRRYIATSCPAIIGYVERYHPDIVESLAPIVSPMIAMARVLHNRYGDDLKIVFIGPCIAKKGEAASEPVVDDVDAAMSFIELRELLSENGIRPSTVQPSDFDPPHGGLGALFPISRGMLQAGNIEENLVTGEVVAADGRSEFIEAIREFESHDLNVQLLEALCCNGCIMGPGMDSEEPMFRRRSRVSRFVRRRLKVTDRELWRTNMEEYSDKIDLSRTYLPDDQRIGLPMEEEIRQIMARMGKNEPGDELNCGACGYETCREHAIAIYKGLAESEMCLPYMIEELRSTCDELSSSNLELETAREALAQSEKLAHMGQLAAGIAHEVNNPLGTVLMLSHILLDECKDKGDMKEDLEMIVSEADRCKKIVSGLLHFARKNKVEAKSVDLDEMVERVVKTLSPPDTVKLNLELGDEDTTADIDRDQVTQVLINLASNALAAMDAGSLTIRTGGDDDRVWFAVEDTGTGIPEENRNKIFDPFFTTKPAGEGTGLGLSVSYGIVKMHHGDIKVSSNADEAKGPTGTTFTVTLPRKRVTMAGSTQDAADGAANLMDG